MGQILVIPAIVQGPEYKLYFVPDKTIDLKLHLSIFLRSCYHAIFDRNAMKRS